MAVGVIAIALLLMADFWYGSISIIILTINNSHSITLCSWFNKINNFNLRILHVFISNPAVNGQFCLNKVSLVNVNNVCIQFNIYIFFTAARHYICRHTDRCPLYSTVYKHGALYRWLWVQTTGQKRSTYKNMLYDMV